VGLFNRKQILRCHWCGNKLKDKEEYREPDNTQTILCRNCFDKALDKLINQGGTRVQSPSDYSGRYNDFSSDYKNLSDREISKKNLMLILILEQMKQSSEEITKRDIEHIIRQNMIKAKIG
jgi:hypothetical protein